MTISNQRVTIRIQRGPADLFAEEVAAEVEILRHLLAKYDRGILAPIEVVWEVGRAHQALRLSVACYEDALTG